jgi:hypothetical protein
MRGLTVRANCTKTGPPAASINSRAIGEVGVILGRLVVIAETTGGQDRTSTITSADKSTPYLAALPPAQCRAQRREQRRSRRVEWCHRDAYTPADLSEENKAALGREPARLLERFPSRYRGSIDSFPWRAGASHAHVPYIRVKTAIGRWLRIWGIFGRAVRATSLIESMISSRLDRCKTFLQRLAQDAKSMAAALGEFIQAEHAMVDQRHVARHRHVAPPDQPHIRDGMVGCATRARRDQRRAVTGEASDAVDTRGLNRLSEGHRRQDGGESAGQHRRARPGRPQEKDVMGRTPA